MIQSLRTARLYGNICFSVLAEGGTERETERERERQRVAAQRLPLAGRMQTLNGEIPLQLIKEHSARACKREGANEFSVSGSSSSRGCSDISKVELKEL